MTVVKERPADLGARYNVPQSVLALAAAAALFMFVLAVYGIRYATNDDATLANIAAGAYGPDRIHLIYVNILYGCLIRPLYLLAGSVNWYVIVQLVLMFVCCAVLCRIAMERLGTAAGLCLYGAVAVPFLVQMVYLFQYVKNAGFFVATGLLLVAVTLGRPDRRTVLGVALVVVGSMLRWQMFCAVGGLSAALLLGRFFELDRAGKRRAAATMAVLFALVFGAKAVDVLAYRVDDGWRAYTEYNAARTQFSDYKNQLLSDDENPFAAQGISENDYVMLRRWDFYDGDVFPTERVAELAERAPGRSLRDTLKAVVRTGLSVLHGTSWRYCFVLLLAAGAVLLRFNRRALPFWGTMILLGLEVAALGAMARFPSYVEVPLLLAGVLFGLYCLGRGELRCPAGVRVTAVALALLLAISFPTLAACRASSEAYWEYAVLEEGYFQAMNEDKEHLYLLSTYATSVVAGMDIWNPRPENFFSNIVVVGGWMSHSPSREQALAAYGLSSPLTGAVDNPAVYVSYQGIENAVIYASEHTGRTVEAVICGDNAFAAYQLRTATADSGS